MSIIRDDVFCACGEAEILAAIDERFNMLRRALRKDYCVFLLVGILVSVAIILYALGINVLQSPKLAPKKTLRRQESLPKKNPFLSRIKKLRGGGSETLVPNLRPLQDFYTDCKVLLLILLNGPTISAIDMAMTEVVIGIHISRYENMNSSKVEKMFGPLVAKVRSTFTKENLESTKDNIKLGFLLISGIVIFGINVFNPNFTSIPQNGQCLPSTARPNIERVQDAASHQHLTQNRESDISNKNLQKNMEQMERQNVKSELESESAEILKKRNRKLRTSKKVGSPRDIPFHLRSNSVSSVIEENDNFIQDDGSNGQVFNLPSRTPIRVK